VLTLAKSPTRVTRVHTATLDGLNAIPIEVEVSGTRGKPGLTIIGLPNRAVDEAKERITAALNHCQIRIRAKKTVVNLAPADILKRGTSFDLAIAVGLLELYQETVPEIQPTAYFGELSLDGSLKPIRGLLPLILSAQRNGYQKVVFPQANQAEVQCLNSITLCPLNHLNTYIRYNRRHQPLAKLETTPFSPQLLNAYSQPGITCLSQIRGQSMAKRALEIAASGGHNLLLTGPPGSGKSTLAQSLITLLPPLTYHEALEVNALHSISGLSNNSFIDHRPFRSPHHTTTLAGLIGGGMTQKPGEISLSHRGVLFLDELPEFSSPCLEALRQPLESGAVSLVNNRGQTTYQARFTLVAAANLCPCGYFGSARRRCTCSLTTQQRYLKKLSGPLLDRLDLKVAVQEIELSTLARDQSNQSTESSQAVAIRVASAREMQKRRYETQDTFTNNIFTNAELKPDLIHKHCQLSKQAESFLSTAGHRLNLTVRGYYKTIKVARTIADLEASVQIVQAHLAEALQYRQA
jgi:magnesium chelatase family protein